MKQFCKDHKFICVVFIILFLYIIVNIVYFLQDQRKHNMVLHDMQLVADELNGSSGHRDYLAGAEAEASRGCGRGQGKFGPGAIQCSSRIVFEGEIFEAWQAEHVLLGINDAVKENDFSFLNGDLRDVIPGDETEYMSEVFPTVHNSTGIQCGMRYEYLNDEEKNEKRMYPVDLPYITLTMGCNDTTRLERLLDREILR